MHVLTRIRLGPMMHVFLIPTQLMECSRYRDSTRVMEEQMLFAETMLFAEKVLFAVYI